MSTLTTETGTSIFYVENGSGPQLLQLHGVGLGHWNVSKLTERLKRNFTCVDIDMPGYGESDSPARSGGVEDLADEVAAFIRGFADGPLPVHGTSFGGLVATVLAGKHPDVVSRVVISVCLPWHDKAALHRRRLWERVAAMQEPGLYAELTVHNGFARQFFERPDADEIIAELVDAMEAASPDAKAYLEGVNSMRQTDVMSFAREIEAPALVLGGAEDQMTPVDPAGEGIGVRKLAEATPDARLEIVQNAGHYIVLEQPDEVARLITDFLEE